MHTHARAHTLGGVGVMQWVLGLPVCDGAPFDKGGLDGFRELLVEVILAF